MGKSGFKARDLEDESAEGRQGETERGQGQTDSLVPLWRGERAKDLSVEWPSEYDPGNMETEKGINRAEHKKWEINCIEEMIGPGGERRRENEPASQGRYNRINGLDCKKATKREGKRRQLAYYGQDLTVSGGARLGRKKVGRERKAAGREDRGGVPHKIEKNILTDFFLELSLSSVAAAPTCRQRD